MRFSIQHAKDKPFSHDGLREYFDHRLQSAQDVERYLGLETLGIVPEALDPLADAAPFGDVRGVIDQISDVMQRYRAAAPTHEAMLARLLDPVESRRPSFVQTWGHR